MKNFSFKELIYSPLADVQGFSNEPYFYNEVNVYTELEKLVDNVLDPIREFVNAPVVITSGYRCSRLNSMCGGVPDSQHRTGNAADFYVENYSRKDMKRLFMQLSEIIDYDQLILYTSRCFIHVSYRDAESNRHQAFMKK